MNATHGAATRPDSPLTRPIAFIGGGNMASAILGGLVKNGHDPAGLLVVDPGDAQRARLGADFGVRTWAEAGPALADAGMVVWAVKPQHFQAAAAAAARHVRQALHLSVMAGIPGAALARALGALRLVRAMPNTPALIGQGIAGLYARPEVDRPDRAAVEAVLAPTGRTLWVDREEDLDAVTALSGSGPAYVFYFVEAMMEAAVAMGLTAEHGRQLALATFSGSAALATQSTESPQALRAQVTSKGGTTHAAVESLEHSGVRAAIVGAVLAARDRARALGIEFGA